MKRFRICEYKNGLGKKYFTVEKHWLAGWHVMQEMDYMTGYSYTIKFKTYAKAQKWIHESVNEEFNKVNCTDVVICD